MISMIILLFLMNIITVIEQIQMLWVYLDNELNNITNSILNLKDGDNNQGVQFPQDPVRFWPSGTTQTAATIGASMLVYRGLANVNPRLRVLAALGVGGFSTANMMYHSAIENPYGFNRFMYGLNTYFKTGQYPSLPDSSWNESNPTVKNFEKEAVSAAQSDSTVMAEVKKVIDSNTKTDFISSDQWDFISEWFKNILNNFSDFFLFVFRPGLVNGYLDDLLGQQYFILYILLLSLVSSLLLAIAYIINNIIYINKDRILAKFNNKWIVFYIKYQAFFVKLSLIYLPVFLLLSILLSIEMTYYLVCHPIPFETLNMDLHVWVTNKNLYYFPKGTELGWLSVKLPF